MADDDVQAVPDEPIEEPEQAPDQGPGWNWWLLVIPLLALAVLAIVLLFGANTLDPDGIHDSIGMLEIVVAGAILLAILLVVELVLIFSGHPENLEDEDEPAPGPQTPAAREDVLEPPEPVETGPEIEMLSTDDEVEGRRVLEVARPPKGTIDAGVYATTYVEVDTEAVLRLEEMVATRA